MASRPFFSVLITAYNRPELVVGAVQSASRQTFADFEVVVVDDGSTDGTGEALAELAEPRLRVVRHERNRGISPARATAVRHARGEWCVVMDSDWELFPHSLARLHEVIAELPPGVRVIRSRVRWDDGHLAPEIMPQGVTGYHERLRWIETLEKEGVKSSDAGHCIHRAVFATMNYFDDRRGAMETLWELNLARLTSSLWIPDALTLERSDAVNSHSRDVSIKRMVPRLLKEAPDALWMARTLLDEHGPELIHAAPHFRQKQLQLAAMQAFRAGERRAGIRYSRAALRNHKLNVRVWVTFILGLMGPRVLVYVTVFGRWSRSILRTRSSGLAGGLISRAGGGISAPRG